MTFVPGFFLKNTLLGVGLAMDAFSVSVADGLNEPTMTRRKSAFIAIIFGLFQGAMPLIGWFCVSTIVQHFSAFETMIPWIALLLLCWIGGKMLYEGIRCKDGHDFGQPIVIKEVFIQGIATSIDALSVGFTIAEYDLAASILAALLIAGVTFLICWCGVAIGEKIGTRLAGKAGIMGGSLLILIGIQIFLNDLI